MNALSGLCQSVPWTGNSSSARSTGGFSDPTVANIYNGIHAGDDTRTQGLQLMKQTLQDLAEHKITPAQMLEVYDQLKAAGVDGPEMDKLKQMFHELVLPRDKVAAMGLGALDRKAPTLDGRFRTLGQSVIEARDMLTQAASARAAGQGLGNTAAGFTGNNPRVGPILF